MEAASFALAVGCGAIIGLSLALTGSGGTALAVPLLMYGLKLSPHRAVCVSMVAVGSMALVGLLPKLRGKIVEVRTGLAMAAAGMMGAPVGTWMSRYLSEKWLLFLFAALMLFLAARLFAQAAMNRTDMEAVCETGRQPRPGALVHLLQSRNSSAADDGFRRKLLVCGIGLFSGVLSGLTGVGGGIIIVPAMILLGMEIRKATATSLLVVGLISVSATSSHFLAGQRVPLGTTLIFAFGALLGLGAGTLWCNRISGPRLQQSVAAAMIMMAGLMVSRGFGH
ncbi:MAG: hypothetical protein ABS95_02670 [Verrucomicrobia bacterium SCN 57-15]|nr:MAG: hypothetical protein ABS95_02670 [Verrucomicrobia bacterium SCN 57-15]